MQLISTIHLRDATGRYMSSPAASGRIYCVVHYLGGPDTQCRFDWADFIGTNPTDRVRTYYAYGSVLMN